MGKMTAIERTCAAVNGQPRPATLDTLTETLRRRRDEFQQLGHIPQDIVEQFKQVGVYRALVPECFGGSGASVSDFLRLIETISTADGSAGWVASFGFSTKYLSSLPLETLAEVYAETPDIVFSGAVYPSRPVVSTEDGVRVSGRWGFGSGCMGASLIGVGIKREGDPANISRMALMPRSEVRIEENWNTIGMFATGSHDIVVEDVFVPNHHTHVRGGPPSVDTPAYRYPSVAMAAQVLAIVGAGVAREAISEIVALASAKNSITGAPAMTNRPEFQIELGKMEAALGAARSWFYEVTDAVWAKCVTGEEITVRDRTLLRLAATQIAKSGAGIARTAYELSGTTGIFKAHPLSRLMLDASVVGQHAFLNGGTWQLGGASLVGQAPAAAYP